MAKETLKGIAVKLARLHQPIEGGGVFAQDKLLNQLKCPGIKMSWDGEHLYWEHKNQRGVIPGPNVAVAIFE